MHPQDWVEGSDGTVSGQYASRTGERWAGNNHHRFQVVWRGHSCPPLLKWPLTEIEPTFLETLRYNKSKSRAADKSVRPTRALLARDVRDPRRIHRRLNVMSPNYVCAF